MRPGQIHFRSATFFDDFSLPFPWLPLGLCTPVIPMQPPSFVVSVTVSPAARILAIACANFVAFSVFFRKTLTPLVDHYVCISSHFRLECATSIAFFPQRALDFRRFLDARA